MKTEQKVIERLNSGLKFQLTLINQSFLHARIANYWGLGRFNDRLYSISIAAMKSADLLIDRILFLEGMPNLQLIGKIFVGEDIEEIVDCELRLLGNGLSDLTESIAVLEDQSDYESRSLLLPILNETEEYIDWLETQKWLIAHMGDENYIQSQIGDNQ